MTPASGAARSCTRAAHGGRREAANALHTHPSPCPWQDPTTQGSGRRVSFICRSPVACATQPQPGCDASCRAQDPAPGAAVPGRRAARVRRRAAAAALHAQHRAAALRPGRGGVHAPGQARRGLPCRALLHAWRPAPQRGAPLGLHCKRTRPLVRLVR